MPRAPRAKLKEYDPRELGALCDECPLNGCGGPVPPEHHRGAKLILIGESPAEWEVLKGGPFQGPTGQFLNNQLLAPLGIPRNELHLTNATMCAPPPLFKDWKTAVAKCRPRLINELKSIKSTRWVLAMGDNALRGLLHKHLAIFSSQGGVIDKHFNGSGEWHILPAYHPSYINRLEGRPWYPVTLRHVHRAWAYATGKLKRWEWQRHVIDPGPEMLKLLRQMKRVKKPVGFDVETQGKDPRTDRCMCLSLANRDVGVSIPWDSYIQKGGNEVRGLDTYPDGPEIRRLVKDILEDRRILKLMHNGQYDEMTMRKYRMKIINWFDTMLASSVLYPTTRHRLNDVACYYIHAERWKDHFKVLKDEKGGDAFVNADERELRVYNFKDSGSEPFIYEQQVEELKKRPHGMEIYNNLWEVTQKVATRIFGRGVGIDFRPFNGHVRRLKRMARRRELKLQQLWLLLEIRARGINPAKLTAAKRVAARKGKHSKLHEIVLISRHLGIEVFAATRAAHTHKLFFEHLEAPVEATSLKTGEPSLNKTALTAYESSDNQLLAETARTFRIWKQHVNMGGFLLKRNINNVPIHPLSKTRGIIYPTFRTAGPKTGRWASPIMIVPKKLRDIFVPHDEDGWIVSADWKQLEIRLIADQSADDELLRQIREDEDVYVAAATNIWGSMDVPENDFKKRRQLAKMNVLGRNYGAGAQKLLEQGKPKFPDLTIEAIMFMERQLQKAHPKLEAHRRALVARAYQDDFVEEPYGHRREYFYGAVEPTKVLNFPQQSGGAEIIRRVAMALTTELNWKDEGILLQYHDELVLGGKDPIRLYQLLRKHMRIQLKNVFLEIDVKVGKNWRDSVEVKSEDDIRVLLAGSSDSAAVAVS